MQQSVSIPTEQVLTPTDQILRPRAVARQLGVSLTTLWRLRRLGDLPAPIQISPGAIGWRSSIIEKWLCERDAAR
jgi:prophage regulatory protein